MATDLVTPSNTLAKVRWREQYVSEGVNKKLNGIIPHGVVRGGRLGTSLINLNVTIEADPNSGDSIYSYIDSNGHQVTFRQVGDVTLDLTALASTTVYIGLQITYTISADTVVKWRAFSLAEIQADPTLVVLGEVDVPASGLIPASDITPAERRAAWMTTSPEARDWLQVVENGSFELCRDIAYVSSGDGWPGWDLVYASVAGVNLSVTDTEARSGRHSLRVNLTGAGTQRVYLYPGSRWNVYPGQLYRASVHVKGSSLSGTPSSALGLRLMFYDESGGATAQSIYDLTLSGTFDWTEIAFTGEVPVNSVWVELRLSFYDTGSITGDVYFDDVRLWLEKGEPLDQFEQNNLCDGSLRGLTLDVMAPSTGIIDADIRDALRFRQNPAVGAVLQMLLGNRGGATEFLMQLERGGLSIDNLIDSLGAQKVGSDADAALPRITAPYADGSDYTLLLETSPDVGTRHTIRVYVSDDYFGSGQYALLVTWNASWVPGTFNFQWDSSGDSWALVLANDRVSLYQHDVSGGSPWADSAWSTGAGEALFSFSDALAAITTKLNLGERIDDSATDLAIPRVECDVPAAATGKYTCIFTGDSGTRKVRIYASQDSIGAPTDQSIAIAINAAWDGTQWTRDDNASDSAMYQFTRSHVYLLQRDAAKTDTWADSGWSVGSGWPSIDFEMGGASGSEYGELDLHDGVIKLTGTLTSRTYPAANAYAANRLYAKSIVKGFCRFTTDGVGGAAIDDDASWNVDTGTGITFSGNSAILKMDVGFASVDDYAVVLQLGLGQDYAVVSGSSDADEVYITAFNYSTGIVDLSANTRDVFVVIFGTH